MSAQSGPLPARGAGGGGGRAADRGRAGRDSADHAFYSLMADSPRSEVLEPPELRDRIATTAAETAALYARAWWSPRAAQDRLDVHDRRAVDRPEQPDLQLAVGDFEDGDPVQAERIRPVGGPGCEDAREGTALVPSRADCFSTSRRASCSQVITNSSSPGWMPSSASTTGSVSSIQASGAPSSP